MIDSSDSFDTISFTNESLLTKTIASIGKCSLARQMYRSFDMCHKGSRYYNLFSWFFRYNNLLVSFDIAN